MLSPVVSAGEQAVTQSPYTPTEHVVQLAGEILFDAPVTYPAGVHVEILPGTVVRAKPGIPAGEAPHLTIYGSLSARGEPDAPVRIEVPLHIRSAGPQGAHLSHAEIAPGNPEGCSLTLAVQSAKLSTVAIEGGDVGLCVEPAPELAKDDATVGSPAQDDGPRPTLLAADQLLLQIPTSPAEAATGPAFQGSGTSPELLWAGQGPASVGIAANGLTIRDADRGVLLADGGPPLALSNSTLAGNGIGLESRGGHAHLDHVTFEHNRDWDIQALQIGDVDWQYSQVETACTNIEGRPSHGCELGSIGRSLPLALLGVAFLVTEAGRKLLVRLAIWLRLYSRIDKEDLLDHPVRVQLIELVAAEPGMYQRQIARRVGSYGKAVYHLHRLEGAGFVRSRRDGQYKRYYLPGDVEDERGPTRDRIQRSIEKWPGIHPRRIARTLGLSRQLVGYHVGRLSRAGLVEKSVGDRRLQLFPRGTTNPETRTTAEEQISKD